MVKKRTIYTASDGKEFDNEKEAEEHDKKVIRESIKVYKVYYNPDLNEGRGYGDHGYVYVHANKYHEQFLEYHFCKRVVYHLQSVEDLEYVERHGTEIVRVVFVATEKLSKEDITKISDFVHSSDQIDELSFRQMVNERYETEYYNHDFLKAGHEKGLWHYIRQKDYNIYYAENRIYTKFSEIGEDYGRTEI